MRPPIHAAIRDHFVIGGIKTLAVWIGVVLLALVVHQQIAILMVHVVVTSVAWPIHVRRCFGRVGFGAYFLTCTITWLVNATAFAAIHHATAWPTWVVQGLCFCVTVPIAFLVLRRVGAAAGTATATS